MDRVILHVDLNNFFASVECLDNPSLIGHPVVVAGSQELRHGIVLAKNDIAKKAGVKTGDAIWQAREKINGLVVVACHFEKYLYYSAKVRKIYEEYTDQIEAFGIDECWLDVTASQKLFGNGEQIANTIRERVKKEIGLTVSVGVSWNKIYAKIGSDYKKPDATTIISKENYKKIVFPLPASDMLMIGKKTMEKLKKINIITIGDIANSGREILKKHFGINGEKMFEFASGLDNSEVLKSYYKSLPKSVSNSTTTKKDMLTSLDVKIVITLLSQNIARRLREQNLKGFVVSLGLKRTDLTWEGWQEKLSEPTYIARDISEKAYSIFLKNGKNLLPLRAISVCVSELVIRGEEKQQISFFEEKKNLKNEICEKTMDKLKEKYGPEIINVGILKLDEDFSNIIFKNEIEIDDE